MTTGKYRDMHRQTQRMAKQIDADQPAVAMAFDLLNRALEKAARRPHDLTTLQDEYYCAVCDSRWDEAPETDCEPATLRHTPILKGDEWECAGCGKQWPMGGPEPDGDCTETSAVNTDDGGAM